jgi:hypothetical protein
MWYKSSFSSGGDNCVDVNRGADGSADVRHSKFEDSPILHFTRGEWDAFIQGVKAGEFG